MLDKLSLMVLTELDRLSPMGELIVISKTDLIKLINKKIDFAVLDNIINELKKSDYIILKYIDSEDICFSSQVKTRAYFEKQKEIKKAKRNTVIQIILNCLISGICAFIGSFLAILIFKI